MSGMVTATHCTTCIRSAGPQHVRSWLQGYPQPMPPAEMQPARTAAPRRRRRKRQDSQAAPLPPGRVAEGPASTKQRRPPTPPPARRLTTPQTPQLPQVPPPPPPVHPRSRACRASIVLHKAMPVRPADAPKQHMSARVEPSSSSSSAGSSEWGAQLLASQRKLVAACHYEPNAARSKIVATTC